MPKNVPISLYVNSTPPADTCIICCIVLSCASVASSNIAAYVSSAATTFITKSVNSISDIDCLPGFCMKNIPQMLFTMVSSMPSVTAISAGDSCFVITDTSVKIASCSSCAFAASSKYAENTGFGKISFLRNAVNSGSVIVPGSLLSDIA